MFSRNIVRVNVRVDTTVGQIKASVLKYLNIPYEDLYYLRFKDNELSDTDTVSMLSLSEKTVLVLICRNLDELYNRMRRDRRL